MTKKTNNKEIHGNNFDFLRLLFATFVIITHSYTLSGMPEADWLSQLSERQLTFSYLGVRGFFIISGYLIFESLMRSDTLISYTKKRILRIFPALIAVLILTVLVFGPLATEENLSGYIQNPTAYSYIPSNIILLGRMQWGIDYILDYNPYPNVINGSLWTIPYELLMYILIGSLFFLKNKRKMIVGILTVGYLILYAINLELFGTWIGNDHLLKGMSLALSSLSDFGIFFIGGSLLACLQIKKIKDIDLIALASTAIIILLVMARQFATWQYLILPVVIISIGLLSFPILRRVHRFGDFSYGTYLYAFPIQQILMYYYPLSTMQLMTLTIPLAYIFGLASWHLIEKQAQRFQLKQAKI